MKFFRISPDPMARATSLQNRLHAISRWSILAKGIGIGILVSLAGCQSSVQGTSEDGVTNPVAARIGADSAFTEDAAELAVRLPIKCAAPSTMAKGVTCSDYGDSIVYHINFAGYYGDWGQNTFGLFQTPKGGTRIAYRTSFRQLESSIYTQNCTGGQVEIHTFGSGDHGVPYGNMGTSCASSGSKFYVVDNHKYNELDATLARHAVVFNLSIDYPAKISVLSGTMIVKVYK